MTYALWLAPPSLLAGGVAAGLLVAWLARRLAATLGRRNPQRGSMLRAASGPLAVFTSLLVLRVGTGAGAALAPHWQPALSKVGLVLDACVIAVVAYLALRVLQTGLDRYLPALARQQQASWDTQVLPLAKRLTTLVVFFLALTMVLRQFNVDITALVTTAGVASLAVALAAQDTLANMFAGLSIVMDQPFRVGDPVDLGDKRAGTVIAVGLRCTTIQQWDGSALVIPNKDMANSRVTNFALPTRRRAIQQSIGVGCDTNLVQAKEILVAVMQAHPKVMKEPAPGVWFTDFGEGRLNLWCSCWVADYRDWFVTKDELNMEILRRFRVEGIDIRMPQHTVHLLTTAAAPAGQRDAQVRVAPAPTPLVHRVTSSGKLRIKR